MGVGLRECGTEKRVGWYPRIPSSCIFVAFFSWSTILVFGKCDKQVLRRWLGILRWIHI